MSRESEAVLASIASPGRKAGCGLKQVVAGHGRHIFGRITRPKGRVRIETPDGAAGRAGGVPASPGRKAGCGLKHQRLVGLDGRVGASPGRKAGCGLKRVY